MIGNFCKTLKALILLGFLGLIHAHLKPNAVTYQCNKFRIGRLALMVIDGVAEQRINRIHLAENLVKSILLLIYQYIFLMALL